MARHLHRPEQESEGRRKRVVDVVLVVGRQGNLLQVVAALAATGRLAGGLHGEQEQRDQTAMIVITTSNSISVKAHRR
jgi:hypothetical protein